jgi:L-fucose isomerase
MPVTMCRLNLVKGLGAALQIAEGWTVDLPEKVHDALDQRTNPTWPTTWFAPKLTGHGAFRDVYSVMNNWGANHGAISYGHIGADLISLAAMLRIPVYMHNVAAKIFSVRAVGRRSARNVWRVPISEPAPISARSTHEGNGNCLIVLRMQNCR